MIKMAIYNPRVGTAKTTTAITLAQVFADEGKRVLIIDTATISKRSSSAFGERAEGDLYDFLIREMALDWCVAPIRENIDVLCSSQNTANAEALLSNMLTAHLAFEYRLRGAEPRYDVIFIDLSSSINSLQMAAMFYAKHVLVPVAMDTLSLQGAFAAVATAEAAGLVFSTSVTSVLLPVMSDKRLSTTKIGLKILDYLSGRVNVPVLSPVRKDGVVEQAGKTKRFIADINPDCEALLDYRAVATELAAFLHDSSSA